jgi:hypothetical protein
MAKTYKAGEIGHLGEHNRMSQFIEDAEKGDIPALIGPEGPQGPEGPEGPKGEDGADGQTPAAMHSAWTRVLTEGEDVIVFEVTAGDPAYETIDTFDPANAHVFLNGIKLINPEDYVVGAVQRSVRNDPDAGIDLPKTVEVTLTEPANEGDVMYFEILYAFAITKTSYGADPTYMRDFGGMQPDATFAVWQHVEGALRVVGGDPDLELKREAYKDKLIIWTEV